VTAGNGCASVRREKFKPLGGPDGADGGDGGDVVLVVRAHVASLLDYHYHPHQKATSGKQGQGSMRTGAKGTDVEVPVPNGTGRLRRARQPAGRPRSARAPATSSPRAARAGSATPRWPAPSARPRLRAARRAGRGPRRRPRAQDRRRRRAGRLPERRQEQPDRRAVGARPKIADYPFTTLVPNLGVVEAAGTTFTVADVPA
jgi:GTP-binding protein